MFNIQLIQDKRYPLEKWIVWKRNIGENYFSHIVPFRESNILEFINPTSNISRNALQVWRTLAQDESKKPETNWKEKSLIVNSDLFRKFHIEEYLLLSRFLRKLGFIYNKKKDEFIKISHDEY